MGMGASIVTREHTRAEWTRWFLDVIADRGVGELFDALEEVAPGLTLFSRPWPFRNKVGNSGRYPWCGSVSTWGDSITLQLSCPMAQGEMMVQDFDTAAEALAWLDHTGIPIRVSALDELRAMAAEAAG